ncbi:MAG: ABC transporter permease [Planctomycetota bacterium]|nr:ABC transporter permease [Planctomycetota bacterium]MDA1162700.1 ABC transporter permease [Planctomycetota bacterium]
MWAYITRRFLFNIPVFLGIVLLVMAALRVHDPVYAYLGKNQTQEDVDQLREKMGLNQSFLVQYTSFLGRTLTLNFDEESWDQPGVSVGSRLTTSIGPTLALTIPALFLTTVISISVGLVSAYFRGQLVDRLLVLVAVLGMCVSFLVYIILGQYFGAFWISREFNIQAFAIDGYESGLINWPYYCLLPVLISVIVGMGYDTRFYRAVMVEESERDYITTARAKGVSRERIMFLHMLKNAMIPIVTRIAISLPFLITGSILLEMYFGIPGMGRTLIMAVNSNDFPVIQAFTAVFAAVYIVTNILTDVAYALVDPRVRLA